MFIANRPAAGILVTGKALLGASQRTPCPVSLWENLHLASVLGVEMGEERSKCVIGHLSTHNKIVTIPVSWGSHALGGC